MRKIITQGLIIVALFFSTWYIFTQIDWITILKVQKITNNTEQKLGNLLWEAYQQSETENKNPIVTNTIDSLVTKICNSNNIDKSQIKIHVLNKDEINAFALPNGHLVIYSGLILNTDNQEELSGVICHELAHIQLNHVMEKLIKEVGLSVLISMTTGNGGSEMIKSIAKMLSSSAFDRSLEKEADIKAVDYLINAEINPEPLANFLYKLSSDENDATKYLAWISTHPESKERAEYIIEYSKNNNTIYKPVISTESWKILQEEIKDIVFDE